MNRFQKTVIKQALDQPEDLTEWEYDFINDMAGKEENFTPSEKQNEIINRIGQKL